MSSGECSPAVTMVGLSRQDRSCHVASTSRPEQRCVGHRARGGQEAGSKGEICGKNNGNKKCKMNLCPTESE